MVCIVRSLPELDPCEYCEIGPMVFRTGSGPRPGSIVGYLLFTRSCGGGRAPRRFEQGEHMWGLAQFFAPADASDADIIQYLKQAGMPAT